jgi:hypothetical protein
MPAHNVDTVSYDIACNIVKEFESEDLYSSLKALKDVSHAARNQYWDIYQSKFNKKWSVGSKREPSYYVRDRKNMLTLELSKSNKRKNPQLYNPLGESHLTGKLSEVFRVYLAQQGQTVDDRPVASNTGRALPVLEAEYFTCSSGPYSIDVAFDTDLAASSFISADSVLAGPDLTPFQQMISGSILDEVCLTSKASELPVEENRDYSRKFSARKAELKASRIAISQVAALHRGRPWAWTEVFESVDSPQLPKGQGDSVAELESQADPDTDLETCFETFSMEIPSGRQEDTLESQTLHEPKEIRLHTHGRDTLALFDTVRALGIKDWTCYLDISKSHFPSDALMSRLNGAVADLPNSKAILAGDLTKPESETWTIALEGASVEGAKLITMAVQSDVFTSAESVPFLRQFDIKSAEEVGACTGCMTSGTGIARQRGRKLR